MQIRLHLTALLLLIAGTAGAQTIRENARLRVNSADGIYAKGDTVRVWVDVDGLGGRKVRFDVLRWCSWDAESSREITLQEGSTLLFERVFDESVQYVFELTDGRSPHSFKDGSEGNSFAGVVISPETFRPGFTQPKDFKRYWKREIRAMRKDKARPVITKDRVQDGFRTYHVDINCVGPAPVRAYISHPADAAKGSLPIIINLHAAGRPGAPSRDSEALRYAMCREGGALAMDINAHGMLDDQPIEYYDSLNAGVLNNYQNREPKSLDDYYFKWMMLRAVRALDYLCADPLWDGRNVIVTGTSQGGYQSAFLAGVDKRVSHAVLTVPAGVDQGSPLQGRPASWPKTINKFRENTLAYIPYLDPAAFLWNTKAEIWCEIGLYDYTCPAANLLAVLNTVSSKKTILTTQRPHSMAEEQRPAHKPVDDLRWEYFRTLKLR